VLDAPRTRSLLRLKQASRSLPPSSFVRTLILGEPDELSAEAFDQRAEVWVRAIFAEEEHVRVARSSEVPLARIAVELADSVKPNSSHGPTRAATANPVGSPPGGRR
jgi:hypothetical protein